MRSTVDLKEVLKNKAAFNDGLASRYQAAQTRLRKFEEAGPPTGQPREQHVTMRLTGGPAPVAPRATAAGTGRRCLSR